MWRVVQTARSWSDGAEDVGLETNRVGHHTSKAKTRGEDAALIHAQVRRDLFEDLGEEQHVVVIDVPPAASGSRAITTLQAVWGYEDGGAIGTVFEAIPVAGRHTRAATKWMPNEDQPIRGVVVVAVRNLENVLALGTVDV